MNMRRIHWVLFSVLAAVFFWLWLRFSYPQFSIVDLSVGRHQALSRAKEFLGARGIDTRGYLSSIVFTSGAWSDTFLQKTLGFSGEKEFLERHGHEIFSWQVRFFRELQKEQFTVDVSPKDGRVVSFEHQIDDLEERETPDKAKAQQAAESFLERTYGLNMSGYVLHEEKARKFDNRLDYSFSWEKQGVYVPWKPGGGAKLIAGATVSGSEIREFFISELEMPETFHRFVEREMANGAFISAFAWLLFLTLVVLSIVALIRRRPGIRGRPVRTWFLACGLFLALVNAFSVLNDIQDVLSSYSTQQSLPSFLGSYFLSALVSVLFTATLFVVPGLAGESMQEEQFPQNTRDTLSHYIRSSFFSRGFARRVMSGYLIFCILLGLQAVIFHLGQSYLGVWKQWISLSQFSSSLVPFFGAFAVGLTASLTEESVFRLFGITWLKSRTGRFLPAILISAVIWGFGHSQYAIFPVWFRGIEVSCIGIFLGWIFVRFGIVPLIIAHYLFDVFWGVSPYMLGKSPVMLAAGAAAVMLLPLCLAAVSFLFNRSEEERPASIKLDEHQTLTVEILRSFIASRQAQGDPDIRRVLVDHGWDPFLVDKALER